VINDMEELKDIAEISAPVPNRFEAVDVLRGLAALWVVLSHYLPYWTRYFGPAHIIVPNEWGYYSVKLFFVISGFCIFRSLCKCDSIVDFAVNRFSRLYPAYWASLLIATTAGVLVFGDQFWMGGFVVNGTMLQDFLGYSRFDNVYWSQTVLISFFVLAGCSLAFRLHNRPLPLVTVWLAAACAWVWIAPPSGVDQRDYFAMILSLDYAPYFTMGIVFHEVTERGWSHHRAAVILFAAATEFLIAGWVGFCVAFFSALLFLLAINGRLAFLTNPVFLWLGAISYSLYLIHRNLGYQSLRWMHEHQLGPALAVSLAIFGALILASLITHGIERPSLRGIRSWHRAWKARHR
jgi:peptidoglycan/LPS O-acetylase OafA/YrhL